MKKPETEEEYLALFPPEQRERVRSERENHAVAEMEGIARDELFPPPLTPGVPNLKKLQERNSQKLLVEIRCRADGSPAAAVFKTSAGPALVSAHDDVKPGVMEDWSGDRPRRVSDPAIKRKLLGQWHRPSWQPRLDVLAGYETPQLDTWPLVCPKCRRAITVTRAELVEKSAAALKSRPLTSRRALRR